MPDFRYYVNRFQKAAGSTAPQVVSGIADAGGQFAPQWILFFTGFNHAFDTGEANAIMSIGFSDGTNNRCTSFYKQDSVDVSQSRQTLVWTSDVAAIVETTVTDYSVNNAQNALAKLRPSNFALGQFTVNYDLNNSNDSYPVYFLAIGGADFAAQVGHIRVPNSIGDVLTALPNMGAKPIEAVIGLPVLKLLDGLNSVYGVGWDNHPQLFVNNGGGQVLISSHTDSYPYFGYGPPALYQSCQILANDRTENDFGRIDDQHTYGSAGLLTLNQQNWGLRWYQTLGLDVFGKYDGDGRGIYYSYIYGPRVYIGVATQPAGTTPVDQVIPAPFQPGAAIFMSICNTVAPNTQTSGLKFSFGAMDATHRGGVFIQDKDSVSISQSWRVCSDTYPILMSDYQGTQGHIFARAALKSLGEDNLTLHWDLLDGVQRQFIFIIFEKQPSPTYGQITVNKQVINAFDPNAQFNIHAYIGGLDTGFTLGQNGSRTFI